MYKKWLIFGLLFLPLLVLAQNKSTDFNTRVDTFKQQDNFSEFIYAHLDEFAENPSVEKLAIFTDVSSKIWRKPAVKAENEAMLYLYVNHAYYLKEYGFINQSSIQYEKAYNHYNQHAINTFNIVEFCLKPLANNYTRLGDVDRAEDLLKIIIEKAKINNDLTQIISAYSNLAIVYRTKGEYKTALNYLNIALDQSETDQQKSKIYSDISINYLLMEKTQLSIKNAHLSQQLNVENELGIKVRNSKTMGACYLKNNEFEKALIEFNTGLKNAFLVFGKNDREVAKIYNQIAEVWSLKNKFDKALSFYQKSLITLLPKYDPKTVFTNPLTTFFYPENTLKDALDGRARIFIFKEDYENALKNFELAFAIETEIRATYLTQNAMLNQQQENRNRSEYCIELCYQLFEESKNNSWLERAFQYAEQSKSIILLEARESSFLKSSIKNEQLFNSEKKLIFKKTQLNKRITLEELKQENADVNLLSVLVQDRIEILNKLQLIKQEINRKYPQLNIIANVKTDLNKIREKVLLNDELFVEFFAGKTAVYIFTFSRDQLIKLNKLENDEEFKEVLSDFLKLFSDTRGTALQNNIQNYISSGYKLYTKLFESNPKKNIIIVPDGLFSFIPFDALLTEETTITNFEKLPYLVKNHHISYAYSAGILMNENKKEHGSIKKFIGFFPIFENDHRNLSELKHTIQEAENIANSIEGNFLKASRATKKEFNNSVADYAIVHLSTHATAGDYFTPPAIEFYDETLLLPEIYGYNLQTDLLILSACETGIGVLRKGEGAMSLARGFSYAGVKNLLVSLWKVNDKSTSEIFSEFYKNGNKSVDLHNSKLAYLENNNISASKKSPYYWASFIYIGEIVKEELPYFNIAWILIAVFIVFGGYIILKRVNLTGIVKASINE